MAQPPPVQPPPQTWFPAVPPKSTTPQLIAVILILAVIGFSMFPILFTGPGTFFPSVFVVFLCVPFLFILIVILIAVSSASSRRRIPPPPPIQQPMVPAGQQGPVALNCPNCGGPPTNVDRFGIAVCGYCGTRFLVR